MDLGEAGSDGDPCIPHTGSIYRIHTRNVGLNSGNTTLFPLPVGAVLQRAVSGNPRTVTYCELCCPYVRRTLAYEFEDGRCISVPSVIRDLTEGARRFGRV